MAGSSCQINKNNINIINENDSNKRADAEATLKLTKINEDLIADMKVEYPNGGIIDEDILTDFIEKRYGAKSENMKAAMVIYFLMDAVSFGRERMYTEIITHIPPEVKAFDSDGNIDLTKLPISTLKFLYNEALKLYKAVSPTGEVYSNFGGIIAAIRTPKELAKFEPSGAYWLVQEGVKDYPNKISSRINTFVDQDSMPQLRKLAKYYKLPKPTMAMNTIYSEVKKIVPGQDPEILQDLFHKVMMGWAYIEDGVVYINQDYGPLRDDTGSVKTYMDPTKKDDPRFLKEDVIFGFQDPISLDKYNDMKKGNFAIAFGKGQMEKFQTLYKQQER